MILTATAIAGLSVPAVGSVYAPVQAITSDLGSKRAVGYFTQAADTCRVTLMVAEAIDPERAAVQSAARLRLGLVEGQSVTLDSEEGRFIELTCGKDGESLSVMEGQRVSERTPTQ